MKPLAYVSNWPIVERHAHIELPPWLVIDVREPASDVLIQRLAKRIVAIGQGDHVATLKEHGRMVTALLHVVVALLRKADDEEA